jgi:hypothetical protein
LKGTVSLVVVEGITYGERPMAIAKKRELSVGLERLRWRFERYRRSRKGRPPIPDGLWSAAARAAGRFGVNRTAEALRLNYYDLKKRVEGRDATASASSPCKPKLRTASEASKPKAARFIELLAPVGNNAHFGHGRPGPIMQAVHPTGGSSCTVELDDAGGDRIRIYLHGMNVSELAELCRGFWSRRS